MWLFLLRGLAGIAFGLVARLFVWLLHIIRARMAHLVGWPPARPVVGGVATLGLMVLVGRDYLGLSSTLLTPAFAGDHVDWWVPLLKLLFTAIALGSGFVNDAFLQPDGFDAEGDGFVGRAHHGRA